ncbi:MAG: glycosyltransferase, partial [Lachnospiraceae bacterium]|nr:glycosyltransferase [Lachnospiraceae bacterium]
MKELLYAKYNRTRRREFQTAVKIYKTESGVIVEKEALCDDAVKHLKDMDASCKKYSDMYNEIVLLETALCGNAAICRYVDGESLSDIILREAAGEAGIIDNIKKYGMAVLDVNSRYIVEFTVTDKFVQLFGNINNIDKYKGGAFGVCNIDSAFDNFILSENRIYSFDNEWIFDVIIPQKFILYRAVKMFYIKYLVNGRRKIKKDNIKEFIYKCGIGYDEQEIFEEMDDSFQCYVHGRDREAIYLDNYTKDIVSYEEMEVKSSLDREHIKNMHNRVNELKTRNIDLKEIIRQKDCVIGDLTETVSIYRRELRNPFYALYRLFRKIAYKILPNNILRAMQIMKNEGVCACTYRIKHKLAMKSEYDEWIQTKEKEEKQKDNVSRLSYTPLISVVIPVYNVSQRLLTECIESVINQSYQNWQLCMADDCSTLPEVKKVLRKYENNPKIDIVYRNENGHISKATNSALELVKGEFVALLDCDDLLTDNALYEVVKRLNENRELDYIYSDEDKIDENSKNRHMPHFKPDWSPDTLMSNMYTCHLSVYRKSIIDKVGGFRVGYEGAQDYDLCLRVTEIIPAKNISHISKILYHWREIASSTASDTGAKPYILEAAFKAKSDAVKRRGLEAHIEYIDKIYQYRVNYIPQGNKKVSVIIPSKDNPDMLSRCIESICNTTKYNNYEIIVVDNGSSDQNRLYYNNLCIKNGCKYIYKPEPFNFSRMCNTGARSASGDYLLFLNDDIEVIDGEWMERMLGQ